MQRTKVYKNFSNEKLYILMLHFVGSDTQDMFGTLTITSQSFKNVLKTLSAHLINK